jgi:hypothetical protein
VDNAIAYVSPTGWLLHGGCNFNLVGTGRAEVNNVENRDVISPVRIGPPARTTQ